MTQAVLVLFGNSHFCILLKSYIQFIKFSTNIKIGCVLRKSNPPASNSVGDFSQGRI
jgi:hypothetical protein